MRGFSLTAAVAMIAAGFVGCSSSHDRDTAHRDYRDDGGGPSASRGGPHDDWTRTQFDPVCGMRVNPQSSTSEMYSGQAYYFDNKDCARRFRENPTSYLHAPTDRDNDKPRDVR